LPPRSAVRTVRSEGPEKAHLASLLQCSERPATVEDLAVPRQWERDLIGGSRNSYVATLMERHSRYVMLVKVANKDTKSIASGLIK
jgi:IS30 family transposase